MFETGWITRAAAADPQTPTGSLEILSDLSPATSLDQATTLIAGIEQELRATPLGWDSTAEGGGWIAYSAIGSILLEAGDSYGALARYSTAVHLAALSRDRCAQRAVLGRIALTHAHRGALGDAEATLAACAALPCPTGHDADLAAEEAAASLIVSLSRLNAEAPVLLAQYRASATAGFASICVDLARIRWCVATNDLECLTETSLRGTQTDLSVVSDATRDIETYGLVLAQVALQDLAGALATVESGASGPLTQFAVARLALQAGFVDRAALMLRGAALPARLTPTQRAERALLDYWLSVARGRPVSSGARAQVRRLLANPDFRCLVGTLPAEILRHAEDRSTEAPPSSTAGAAGAATPNRALYTLTPTELQVLTALPTHRTTTALARVFNLSPNTIKSHLRSIYRKLGCTSRSAAVEIAARYDLLAAFHPHTEPSSATT